MHKCDGSENKGEVHGYDSFSADYRLVMHINTVCIVQDNIVCINTVPSTSEWIGGCNAPSYKC
jgi:hypothetical protein